MILALILLLGASACSVDDPAQQTADADADAFTDVYTQMPPIDESSPPSTDEEGVREKGETPPLDTEPDSQDNSNAMPPEEKTTNAETAEQEAKEARPPMFGFIDAHADTISRALLPQHNAGLFSNNLHVDFERLLEFGTPVQVFALWCADRFVENAFEQTNIMIDFFESEVAKHSDIIEIALDLNDIERNARNNKISAILAIEGGEALMGELDNIDHFYNRGVRIMTLTWNRENELGFGQATNSAEGLKPFGVECSLPTAAFTWMRPTIFS